MKPKTSIGIGATTYDYTTSFFMNVIVNIQRSCIIHRHVFLHLVCKRTQKSLAYKTRLALKSSSDAYKMFVILFVPSKWLQVTFVLKVVCSFHLNFYFFIEHVDHDGFFGLPLQFRIFYLFNEVQTQAIREPPQKRL